MHFVNLIKKEYNDERIIIFVDMDGVISSYDIGKPFDFFNKRPLTNNINVLKEVSKLANVELHVLSICKKDIQIKEKNDWLDLNANFFDYNKRMIISKESNPGISSSDLKINYLKNVNDSRKIILIDDDNSILYNVSQNINNVILYQDSELVD